MSQTLAHFPRNPDYGSGTYRRRLRFASDATGLAAQVDDTHHSYWLSLDHDDTRITGVDAGFMRAPTSACGGAIAGLSALVGLPLTGTAGETLGRLPVLSNCTHLADLACWSLAQIGHTTVWDITIPDQIDTPVWIEIARDGAVVHRWRIEDHRIVAPRALADRPMMHGFMAWARTTFDGDALLAATMLQRGIFVARGRRHIVDEGDRVPLASADGMAGRCWSYSGSRLKTATGGLRYVRDFTTELTLETPPPHIAARLQGSAQ
jgi:hypothetical protein